MNEEQERYTIELTSVEQVRVRDGVEELIFRTDAGDIITRYHDADVGINGVLWVGGAGGGLDGPAGGLYPRLASHLAREKIASLRLHYRYPNDLIDCVLDTLIGVEYFKLRKRSRIALVGHSFGGAVAISAGAASSTVAAVAALSTQTYGADDVANLSPRPLLLMHGMQDEVLPDSCSHYLYQRALEPKRIILYPGCGHGLDACRDQVDRDLYDWLREVLEEEPESL